MKLALREQGAWRLAGLIVVLTLGGIFSTASAQDYWTGAADGNWWNVANWSGGVPTSSDDVVFVTPVPGIGPMIALGAGSVANSLWIQDDYTFTGGDLAFGSGAIRVNLGQAFVLNSQLSGTAGLTKTGGGSLRLTNALNDFTGSILLANGSLVITDSSQLGASTSAIVITESNPMIGNTEVFGFFGGSLFLDGSGGTITLARDLSIQGSGPISDRGGALVSFGDNTLSGVVRTADGLNQPAGQPRNTRLISNQGVLTFANELNVGGTTSHVTILGGVNTAGSGGQFHLTGELSGSSYLDKQGAGALFFDPSLTANFSGRLRISGSATGGQSTVRITSATDSSGNNSIFGTANGTTTSAPVDMNGGVLEIRSDSSLDFGKNVYLRASSTLFAGPGVGGSGVNETMSFGDFRFQANTTATFNSRNGYGFTFGAWTQNDSNNPNTITNNMGGTLTFTGNAWNNSDGSARILTIGGNGNTVIEGSINTSGAGTKTLTKTGTGALSILGVETTLNGPVNISGGALAITDFRSLNNNTGTINLASSSNAGTLIIGTRVAPTAAGLTTSKTINLAGTTGTARIFANQSGTNPVVLNGSFTATGSGAKTFTLGGTNTADNIIHGGIPNSSGTTTLVKVGSGTWVLAGANTYTGTTTVANGTLKLTANAATSTVLPSAAAVTFNDSNGFAGGTFELVGQDGVNNVQNLGTLTTSAGANTISLKPGTGGTASLTFGNIGTSGASTVNIVGADYTNNRVTFTLANGSVGSDGLLSRTVYWEGADFAYRQGGVMRAPVYGTDTGFVTRGTGESLGSAANNEITGSLSTNTISISTLKIAGSHTLSLNSGQTLTLSAGGLLATGGNATVTGGTLALGSQALVTRVNLETDVLTIESAVTGTGGLTKAGMGTLVLATANTRTGATNINEGTVQLSGSGTLSGANVTTTIRQNAVLDLNGVSTGTSIGQFDNTGIVTNTNAAAATLTVGNNNGTGTSYGIIDETNGVISIAKVGTGAQNWYGTSTYTGATTIGSTGLVTVDVLADIGVASGIGKGNATDDATNAASLVFDGSTGGLAYAGSLRDGFVVLGTTSTSTNRLFTLAGTGATLSSTATNNNAIVWGNTGAIVHDDEAARTLILTGTSTGDNTFNPQLTDSGTGANITSLTKTDTGQWNLGNSNNTYTGTTSVNRGILALNHNGALSDGSALVLGNDSGGTNRFGILQMSGVFERDLAGTAEAGSNTITWGTTTGTTGGGGFAAHTDQLIVAIGGLASPSNLTWGAGGFVGTNVTGTNEQALHFGSASALADVEFRNAIDLNGAVRRITVTDNPNTGADFATMTGVLSGTGGVFKDGSGALRLTGLNTYTGNTRVNAGVLAVTSLGNSADALNTPTSVGVSGIAMNDENAVLVGNASTSNAILQYIGAGETSDRKIRINATTGTSAGAQIHADGTGPLILTNVANDMVAGAKLLWLRGTNTDGNMITSQLSDNSGALSVTVDGGATWILTNGVNNYTGLTTAGGGALGIGHNNALGGELRMSNGSVFAYGGDRVIANAVSQANGVRAAFIGDYSLSFTNPYALLQTTSSTMITTNNILGDATLTFAGGVTANSLGDNSRTWTFDGNGTTIIDGTITTTQAGRGLAILKTGDGVLQLGGDYSALSGTNAFNQGNRSVEVRRGTLRMGADNVIPALAGHGGLVLSPTAATNNTAILDLNGTSQTINTLTATTDGTITITNTASGAASLTFGANNATVNFGTGAGTYAITDGVGSVSIAKVGTGVATLGGGTGATTLDYTGTTTVSGGTLNVAAALTGTTGVTVAGGATLNLFNKGADSLIGLNSLSLGVGSGTATLGFELGASTAASDRFATAGVATTANTVAFNLTNLAGFGTSSTYDLITAGSGLSGATYALGSLLPGGFTYNLNTTDTLVQLQLTAISGDLFWRGGVNNSWSGFNAGNSNFTTDLAGSTNAQAAPGALNSVIFSSTAAAGTAINTTLDNNFFVNDLKFTSNPSGVTAVTIAAGTIATNSLTIAPSFGTVGIDVANSAGNVTISAPVVIGANQTWSVASTGASLRIDGALSGTANLTKAGAGTVTLTANNGSYSGDVTISAGTVILGANTAAGSLGTGNIVNNAELIYDRTGTYDLVNTITGTGNLTLRRSTAQFTEAANLGGGNVTLATNASTTLRFIADGAANSQTVSNPISTGTGYAGTLDARGTNGASVTYAGAISVGMNANGYQLVLTGT
ncbi:MAG: autotransporter-associated beta strand repeat-containing protein, partial [Patescibacteria group bacterium]|nr:autotransporter-associated beta strand repeat-containing protein [Patescibacteria group bacterium]